MGVELWWNWELGCEVEVETSGVSVGEGRVWIGLVVYLGIWVGVELGWRFGGTGVWSGWRHCGDGGTFGECGGVGVRFRGGVGVEWRPEVSWRGFGACWGFWWCGVVGKWVGVGVVLSRGWVGLR